MSKIRFDAWCVFEVLHKEDQHFLIEEKEDEKEKCCLFDELVKPLNQACQTGGPRAACGPIAP